MMRGDILTVGSGALGLFWLRWYVPHTMKGLRQFHITRGRPVRKFDEMLSSMSYRFLIGAMTIASMIAIGSGLVSLIAE